MFIGTHSCRIQSMLGGRGRRRNFFIQSHPSIQAEPKLGGACFTDIRQTCSNLKLEQTSATQFLVVEIKNTHLQSQKPNTNHYYFKHICLVLVSDKITSCFIVWGSWVGEFPPVFWLYVCLSNIQSLAMKGFNHIIAGNWTMSVIIPNNCQ